MRADFYDSLPRRYVGAGLLITDKADRVLLVEPTYKPYCEVPGGLVEAGETPPEAARRECLEELGLPLEPGRLLTVDHQYQDGRGDSSMYIYEGGTLTDEEISKIVLPADELKGARFVSADQLDGYTRHRIAVRLRFALTARTSGELAELENGHPRLG